jgi:hypothetical protein
MEIPVKESKSHGQHQGPPEAEGEMQTPRLSLLPSTDKLSNTPCFWASHLSLLRLAPPMPLYSKSTAKVTDKQGSSSPLSSMGSPGCCSVTNLLSLGLPTLHTPSVHPHLPISSPTHTSGHICS